MSYNFKYKHKNSFFWKTKKVVGHGVDYLEEINIDMRTNSYTNKIRKPIDAMVLYFEDGSIERIPEWSNYYMKLGSDWALVIKNKMEKESGVNIKLNTIEGSK